jgi:epoxyqueuosine reductase
MHSLEARIKEQAHALGFEMVGIAPATQADGFDRLAGWLQQGFAGEMSYMHRHAEARRHPSSILAEVRSVIMVGMSYAPERTDGSTSAAAEDRSLQPRGRVARYARGADYHDILRERLRQLLYALQEMVPECRGRAVVDTAPLLERDFARRAGLGWFGKNTMLLNKRFGSYTLLGALLVDMALEPDEAHAASHCGSCTACLDACPTEAFVAPGRLDSRRCIAYLTIELRGQVPAEFRPQVGDWIFGCDVCQEVCPWNRKPPAGREPALVPAAGADSLDPLEIVLLSEEEFRRRFRSSAISRATHSGLRRNAAIVLGNRGAASALPALEQVVNDPDPVVAEAARWAIERIENRQFAFGK